MHDLSTICTLHRRDLREYLTAPESVGAMSEAQSKETAKPQHGAKNFMQKAAYRRIDLQMEEMTV